MKIEVDANYNPNIQYFGPQGHWLSRLIPQFPPGLPQLKDGFNRAAYNHDKAYEGTKEKGFWAWIKRIYRRLKADNTFLIQMNQAIQFCSSITFEQKIAARKYAKLAHKAVRFGGWKFYKPSED